MLVLGELFYEWVNTWMDVGQMVHWTIQEDISFLAKGDGDDSDGIFLNIWHICGQFALYRIVGQFALSLCYILKQ